MWSWFAYKDTILGAVSFVLVQSIPSQGYALGTHGSPAQSLTIPYVDLMLVIASTNYSYARQGLESV